MARRKAESSAALVTPITRCPSLNDVVSAVVRHQRFPKLFHSNVFLSKHPAASVEMNSVGRASESSHRVDRIATFQVLVVAIVLGKCLLQDGNPDAIVVADMREESRQTCACLPQGQPVIDDDRVGHTERVDVDAIDASLAHSVLVI